MTPATRLLSSEMACCLDGFTETPAEREVLMNRLVPFQSPFWSPASEMACYSPDPTPATSLLTHFRQWVKRS